MADPVVQPFSGETNLRRHRWWEALYQIRQPGDPLAEMSLQHGGVGAIDGAVVDMGRAEHCFRNGIERAKSGAAGFGPALPAIVKPPVVVMRKQGNLAGRAGARECCGEDEVSSQARIVVPDDKVGGAGSPRIFRNAS